MSHVIPYGPVLIAMLAGALVVLVVATLLTTARREARISARIRAVCCGEEAPSAADRSAAFVGLLQRVGGTIVRSGLLPAKTCSDLEGTLVAAGYRAGSALPLFVGVKVLLVGLLPALAWVTMEVLQLNRPPRLIVVAAMAALGLILPDIMIRRLRKRYLAQVERGLADALDLLIICAEAGLPLEGGIDRVATDFRTGNRPAASEFELIGQEMRILPDRRQALANAGKRTGLEGIVRLGAMLAQSMQYGTPLAQALRTLAAESRATVLNRFEARAARLPVLLTLPMMVFILPCVFIVVGTPAIVQALNAFVNH
jgi:tight adherence protein C